MSLLMLSSYVSMAGQFGQFMSYFANGHSALLDNYAYGTATRPDRFHYGGGGGMGASINDEFNLIIGVEFMRVTPNNTRSDYSFCGDAFEDCLPQVTSNQLFFPIGVEYYSNTDRSPFQSFYVVKLVPSISLTEKQSIATFIDQVQVNRFDISNSGPKFQDLHFQLSVNNEFSIDQNHKIYVEPGVSHSLLFRDEDVVNPDYILSLRVGYKFRADAK